MKNIAMGALLMVSPILNLMADGEPEPLGSLTFKKMDPAPISRIYEHKVNFGLLHIGYERIKPDSVYTGFDGKVSSILLTDKNSSKTLNHYVNGELRLGYNHTIGEADTVRVYGGVGFSVFSMEEQEGKLRNWNYGTAGVRYLHQFGDIFEMGLHLKGSMSISQKRYLAVKPKPVKGHIPTMVKTDGLPQVEMRPFHNENAGTHLTAVKVSDTRFITQIGLPLIWHIGAQKNWEIQFEPYYMQIPNDKMTHVLGSNVTVGYCY